MVKFRKMLVDNKGFTLIELLVVIAVLGILAAIAIPRLTGVTDKARLSEGKSIMGTLTNAQGMYAAENDGNYTETASDLYEYVDSSSLKVTTTDPGTWDGEWYLVIDDTADDEFQMTLHYESTDADLAVRANSGWNDLRTRTDSADAFAE